MQINNFHIFFDLILRAWRKKVENYFLATALLRIQTYVLYVSIKYIMLRVRSIFNTIFVPTGLGQLYIYI